MIKNVFSFLILPERTHLSKILIFIKLIGVRYTFLNNPEWLS